MRPAHRHSARATRTCHARPSAIGSVVAMCLSSRTRKACGRRAVLPCSIRAAATCRERGASGRTGRACRWHAAWGDSRCFFMAAAWLPRGLGRGHSGRYPRVRLSACKPAAARNLPSLRRPDRRGVVARRPRAHYLLLGRLLHPPDARRGAARYAPSHSEAASVHAAEPAARGACASRRQATGAPGRRTGCRACGSAGPRANARDRRAHCS
mmetsp:Transcript_10250/g.33822  ORF Transcript_10250/g.33822 Transcript_10250/m.33822 type:complete len:211 (-) Transcript_10250:703-1335(-)